MKKTKDTRYSKSNYSNKLLSDKTPFAINESFKQLRTNIFYTSKNETCPVFCVTSSYAHAGKSTVISNTAISHSMLGKKVLLIDGDMRCPVLQLIFSMEDGVGLSELLASAESGFEAYTNFVRKTEYEGLDIITSGRIPPNPSELLSSAKMKEILEAAKEKYDYIFIDTPPICEVSDGCVISEIVTGYIFVIRSGVTDSRSVSDALSVLEQSGANVVGLVLNDVNPKFDVKYSRKNHKYGYGKYKKYGYNSNYINAQAAQNEKTE